MGVDSDFGGLSQVKYIEDGLGWTVARRQRRQINVVVLSEASLKRRLTDGTSTDPLQASTIVISKLAAPSTYCFMSPITPVLYNQAEEPIK